MEKIRTFFIAIIVIAIFVSCGQSPKERMARERAMADTVAVSRADTTVNIEPHKDIKVGAAPVLATPPPGGRFITRALPPFTILNPQGTLVYYCSTRMLENTDNNVSVTITKEALQKAIAQLGKKVAATTGRPAESIEKDITGSSITIAAKMKVELKYGDKDFETIYKPENDDQIFDGKNDMNWDWIIKPMKVGALQLSIIVSAYDEKNGRWIAAQTSPKIFNIKVQVDPRG